MPSIGQTIAQDRERIGLTQEQLASRLGVTQQAVSRWEDGRSMPRAKRLREILSVLGKNSQTAAALAELATPDGAPRAHQEAPMHTSTPAVMDYQTASQLAVAAQQIAQAAKALAESATAIAQAAERLASSRH